ncbi:NAD(P)-binding protein [Leifsonia xyli]|uniref:NAD(P)-binding protein n=1 Tax=Leifsonia xyli TaxID=1575 RepID=UPI003D6655E3
MKTSIEFSMRPLRAPEFAHSEKWWDERVTTSRTETQVVVIGAGQAGLAVAYYLRRFELTPGVDFIIYDRGPRTGERGSTGGMRSSSAAPTTSTTSPAWRRSGSASTRPTGRCPPATSSPATTAVTRTSTVSTCSARSR